ncbi:hypothetical protein [Oceaniglobus indicus]|uniref:hypothetical protein n=1 Tax=Oceaniglobus indicus TaxID=2047749 RepID=UPI0011AB7A8B|nr:hypothetical protein [Oceaniglobus indicus]
MAHSYLRFCAMICAVPMILSTPVSADSTTVLESKCAEGQAANEHEYWEYIKNNAIRTADNYAAENNPRAVFIFADVEVYFQIDGEYVGEYLVKLLSSAHTGTALAMLRPNFEFCGDLSRLDDEREDLFTVVVAKLDGVDF